MWKDSFKVINGTFQYKIWIVHVFCSDPLCFIFSQTFPFKKISFRAYDDTNTAAPPPCTIQSLYSAIALYPKTEIQKPLFNEEKDYFWVYFSYIHLGWNLQNLFRFLLTATRNIIFGILKIGQNNSAIANLEFEITVSSKIMSSFQPNNLGENIC